MLVHKWRQFLRAALAITSFTPKPPRARAIRWMPSKTACSLAELEHLQGHLIPIKPRPHAARLYHTHSSSSHEHLAGFRVMWSTHIHTRLLALSVQKATYCGQQLHCVGSLNMDGDKCRIQLCVQLCLRTPCSSLCSFCSLFWLWQFVSPFKTQII